jgi:hypothetical protein
VQPGAAPRAYSFTAGFPGNGMHAADAQETVDPTC